MDADTERVVVVGLSIERKIRPLPGGDYSLSDTILHEVVVEIRARGQSEHQVGELGLRFVGNVPYIPQSVIPMITTDVFLEHERVARKGRVDRSDAPRSVDAQSGAVAPSADLELLTAPHEIVVYGVNGKQDSHPAVRLGMKHQQVTVRFRSDVDSHEVTQPNTVFAQPELHGRVGLLSECLSGSICQPRNRHH